MSWMWLSSSMMSLEPRTITPSGVMSRRLSVMPEAPVISAPATVALAPCAGCTVTFCLSALVSMRS